VLELPPPEPLLPPEPLPPEPLLPEPLPDVDGVLAGVLLGALSLFGDELSVLGVLPLSELAGLLSPDGFEDEYKSLYQPLPLSWNAVREISRSSASLPHASHVVLSGSLMRCWYSNSLPHEVQRYS
jgi:hypothetical protein